MSLFNNELAKYFLVPERDYTLFNVLILVLILVVMLLKGLALWRSARKGQNIWFWVFIFINTLGILEIIYLLTNTDEFKIVEKKEKKSKFKLSFKRKAKVVKAEKAEKIELVEPEIAALNDLENI
jgi:hypothetical protein